MGKLAHKLLQNRCVQYPANINRQSDTVKWFSLLLQRELYLYSPHKGTQAITGYLNGIAGTLSRDGSDNYAFTRTTAGTTTYVAPNSPFIPDIFSNDFTTFIIFIGRNNLSLPNDIIRDIDACVALQKP